MHRRVLMAPLLPMWFDHLRRDVIYALRQCVRAKGHTTVVVLMLALGIGATTAIYSAVDVMILNPIPGPDAERLVQVGEWSQASSTERPYRGGATPPTIAAIGEAGRDFFEDTAWAELGILVDRRGTEFDMPIVGTRVSGNFFQLMGQRALLGRVLGPDDAVEVDYQTAPPPSARIVLSHFAWTTMFEGDPKILGREIELSGTRHTVVGVMPPHFKFPGGSQFWVAVKPRPLPSGTVYLPASVMVGRLKLGLTASDIQPMLDTVAQRLLSDYPATDRGYGTHWRRSGSGLKLWCATLKEVVQTGTSSGASAFDNLRRTLFGFLAAIGFLLAIVCANVANLALVRTEGRQQELAVRTALGAGRGQIARQLLTESLLLSLLGGLGGIAVAHAGMKLLASFTPHVVFRPLEIDGRMLAVALLVSMGCGIVSGLAPALRAGRGRVSEALAQGGYASSGSRRGRHLSDGLVVLEVSLAVVLLVGAGLMVMTVVKVLAVDPGFNPAHLFRVHTIWGPRSGFTPQTRNSAVVQLHERVAAMPGVSAVGIFGRGPSQTFLVDDAAEPVSLHVTHTGVGEADFFRAVGIPLIAGRLLHHGDGGANGGAVVVNRKLAEACWPGADPIGRTLTSSTYSNVKYQVVGVVGDARFAKLDEVPAPTMYPAYHDAAAGVGLLQLVVRSSRDPGDMVPALRQTLHAFSPGMRNPTITVVRDLLFDGTSARRLYRNYLVGFAAVGLALSALGIYGVLAHSVARRTREMGIRMALGADRGDVVRMVVGEGIRLTFVGIALGLLLSFWLTQLLRKQLYDVEPTNPVVLIAVVCVLLSVSLLAGFLPARRAAAVNPIDALKA